MKYEVKHGRIFFGEGSSRWSTADPMSEQLDEALHTARYRLSNLTQAQAYLICEAAGAYRFLTTYPLGVEHCIAKLRHISRACRERDQ